MLLSHVQFFVNPRTIAHQAPLSMGGSVIPIEDTAHVKAIGSTIVCGALTMGRAGVLGPGPTAERKKTIKFQLREVYV